MKINAQIVDVKLTTTASGDVIGKVTTSDGKIIYSKGQNTPKVENLTAGTAVEIEAHEEKNPKGTFLVLDDVKVIEHEEAAPEAKEPEPAQPAKAEEIVHETLIQKITEGESHGKKYWRIETDFFGTIFCADEILMCFNEGDTCELTCRVTEKGSVIITGVKIMQKAQQTEPPAQPVQPAPPVPPKAETGTEQQNAESQKAEPKKAEQKKADPPKTPPVPPQTTVKTPEPPKNAPAPKPAPAPAPKPAAATKLTTPAPTEPTVRDREEDKENPNLLIYRKVRNVPKEALKDFNNGRFSGTDISPMWRIKKLTELFGPVGIGWYVTVDKQWLEATNDAVGEIKAFVNLSLYVKYEGEWSKPIYGNGGNSFQAVTRNGQVVVDDECFKKAFTDAFGSACKLLGIGADVYWSRDPDSKYL